jgi:hypothetical protein
MEDALANREAERKKRKPPKQRDFYTYFDQQLLAAKNDEQPVRFAIAGETYFTDEDCSYTCIILGVDKYDIKTSSISGNGRRRTIWLRKEMVVSTEIME